MTGDRGRNAGPKPHPRTIGWIGTVALALFGCNSILFLLPEFLAGLNAGHGTGGPNTMGILMLIAGVAVILVLLPGWLELILMYPGKVGGISAACTEAFRPYSPMVSALAAVAYWWGWVPGAGLTAYLLAGAIGQSYLPHVPVLVLALAFVAVQCGVNLLGIRRVTRLVIPFAGIVAVLILLSILVPLCAGKVDPHRLTGFHLTVPFPGRFGVFTAVMWNWLFVSFTVPGMEIVACHVGETRNWRRNVPRAMLIAAIMTVVVCVILPLIWLGTLGPLGMEQRLDHVLGPTLAPLFGAGAQAAALGFMVLNSFVGSLVPYSGAARALAQLSDDGLLPRILGRRFAGSNAPWVATLLTGAMTTIFMLLGEPICLFAGTSLDYVIAISVPSVAVLLLRRDAPAAERPWRAPRLTLILGLVAVMLWLCSAIFGLQQQSLASVIVAMLCLFSGYALYAWRQIEDSNPRDRIRLYNSLHFRLTVAVLAVFALDATGYGLAVSRITHAHPEDIAMLGDIFTAVAGLTIAVGLVLPGLIAHTVDEVAAAARRLAFGTIRDFTLAMDALGRGDLDRAHARFELIPVPERGTDELGMMARDVNVLQDEVRRAATGLDQAREGLYTARQELVIANEALRQTVAEQQRLADALAAAREIAQYEALHDGLTGLPNRTHFLARLEVAFARHRADPAVDWAVLFIDLDRFKIINDSLGHHAGDLLLGQVASRLLALLPQAGDNMVARLSGDEFTVLLAGCAAAEEFAARLLGRLGEPFLLDAQRAHVGASIGIVPSLAGYSSTQILLRDADIAMYRAKHLGKGRAVTFEPAMHAQAESRLHIENQLRQALDNRDFELHYQPILDLDSGTMMGVEALVRWRTPMGMIHPGAFIGIAEETGLIMPLGGWILQEACRAAAAWHRAMPGRTPLRIGINISARQFADDDIIARIDAAIAASGILPTAITIEITETAVMQDPERTVCLLGRMKAMGLRISIDDFGTGYSSLGYLHRFPVGSLKIDRSFIADIATNQASQKMVAGLLALAKSMDIIAIAEGIETQSQLDLLHRLGCRFVQGFLVAGPMPAQDIQRLLQQPMELAVRSPTRHRA
jgi:diguanylate cyclase (GGDEF)-like protein